ncbi:antitoxin Xre/MbcA/ParS toxin-binding domain-containing protein [Bradyrhizobium sp. WSM1417]|uniref:antitoxin Xre/MbcA/ParS toxin-binding domain-containing protein n=1 Tax=Bradyrhizobium sp. WSM1417 TaxID=754500 RepID=UPI0004880E71|nr:antitoxin Xre/MbcA/ParS toxin-binding domain-containing protein [Bradyrhizobium sp. WSM1417]
MHDPYPYELPEELSEPDTTLLDDENPDIRKEIVKTIGEDWLHTKNILFNNRKPEELIGTPEEIRLRDIVRQYVVAAIS